MTELRILKRHILPMPEMILFQFGNMLITWARYAYIFGVSDSNSPISKPKLAFKNSYKVGHWDCPPLSFVGITFYIFFSKTQLQNISGGCC